ncbi:MAG: efflux transporter outer membrane subunit, partial [Deltaproteobacteria bacterium]|nr:efflux transporter outer membrane subunit [Deltaproteobacteria bacterium]
MEKRIKVERIKEYSSDQSYRKRIFLCWLLGLVGFGVLIGGCSPVGPNYVPPRVVSPKQWHAQLGGGLRPSSPAPEVLATWWKALGDPILWSLQKRAVAGNLQLKEALARVREARALRGVKRATLFPALDATGGVTRQRTSGNTAVVRRTTLYTAGFDAGWELDIFGGARRSIEAAQAQLEAAQEALTDVLVSLMAEVALNYANVRTYQARLDAVAANIKAQEDIYQLNVSRYKAGLIDELDVQQSLYVLENTRAQVPQLKRDLEAAKNRLAVLLALPPGALEKELAPHSPIPVPPVQVAVGIPADTLRRRPDVRKAERELAAATAQIGVATAELYPKFRLSGSIGLESLSA